MHFFFNQDGALYKSNQIFYDKFTVSVHVFDSSGLFFYLNFLLLKLIVAIVTETNPGVLGNDEYPSYCRLH